MRSVASWNSRLPRKISVFSVFTANQCRRRGCQGRRQKSDENFHFNILLLTALYEFVTLRSSSDHLLNFSGHELSFPLNIYFYINTVILQSNHTKNGKHTLEVRGKLGLGLEIPFETLKLGGHLHKVSIEPDCMPHTDCMRHTVR